jgi:hypothetical protein
MKAPVAEVRAFADAVLELLEAENKPKPRPRKK